MLLSRTSRVTRQLYVASSAASQQRRDLTDFGIVCMVAGGLSSAGAATWLCNRYHVSDPNEYLVRTGLMIDDIKVTKTGIQWPFQKATFVNMMPKNYSFNLDAMSSQKMEFILPGVFTIGPRDDFDSIQRYCKYLLEASNKDPRADNIDLSRLDEFVKGIIEGETRVLAAQMTIEEIFNDRAIFKEKIIKNVGEELEQFGLMIYNANIKELQDAKGSEYFQFLRQRTRSEAENQALVDIAEAKRKSDIGLKEREMITRVQVAEFEARAVENENNRKKEIAVSNADLAEVDAASQRRMRIANIEAEAAADTRKAELQKHVEERRQEQQLATMRADELTKAHIYAETEVAKTEGDAQKIKLLATADLFSQQQKASGIYAVLEAQAKGASRLVESVNGNTDALMQYLMIDNHTYEKLAAQNANAVRDMKPNITIWNTGSTASDDPTAPIRNIMQSIPPLVSTIHDQTGIKPAKWLCEMPSSSQEK